MGTANNQISTVNNLRNNLFYRVDTSNAQYATGTKCVTEAMLTELSTPSNTTAIGRAKRTDVNTAPLRISGAVSVHAASETSVKPSNWNNPPIHLMSFTAPGNVGGRATCYLNHNISFVPKIVTQEFTTTTGQALSTTITCVLHLPDGTTQNCFSKVINPNKTYTLSSISIPTSIAIASLTPGTTYRVYVTVQTSNTNIGNLASAVKISFTPSRSSLSVLYQCHDKLVKYTKILNDCEATVPFRIYMYNNKNVATKFDTVKIYCYYKSTSSSSASPILLLTKEWNKVGSNDSREAVVNVPIYSSNIPDTRYTSYLSIWAGEAGAKQDVRIGYERGSSTIDYTDESYVSCTTKTRTWADEAIANGYAKNLQTLTGVQYSIK